jgi:hypothetical protein
MTKTTTTHAAASLGTSKTLEQAYTFAEVEIVQKYADQKSARH